MNTTASDVEEILERTEFFWRELGDARLFITGGTGFFGRWILESFRGAVAKFGLAARAVVLTRSPQKFGSNAPHLASHRSIELISGDVTSFKFPDGAFRYVISAAADPARANEPQHRLDVFRSIVDGTRRTLEFAVERQAESFLLVSSGAVYGPQPRELEQLSEDYAGSPDPLDARSAYAEAKRAAETEAAIAAERSALAVKVARCFSFIGPYLPPDSTFAAAEFLRDAAAGRAIRVRGDGRAVRSYLYATDLVVALLTILHRGSPLRPYNVGSDVPVSILELAQLVSTIAATDVVVESGRTDALAGARYVPRIERARAELGLEVTVDLREGIRRTVASMK